jgi:putative ABC transport system permease protein
MKFFPLVWSNLRRHTRRTILTIISVALALFLFASLQTVTTTIAAGSRFGSARRLVSTNSTGMVFPLPISYANRFQAVQGVEAVTWASWFGGKYGDGKSFFATFAIDPKSYLDMYPEMVVSEDQKQAFLQDRAGALVGPKLMSQFGWKVGQTVTLVGTIYQGDWPFTIRAVYTPKDPAIGDNVLMFHYDYLDERSGRQGLTGWYIMRIDEPGNAARIAKAIDDQTRNSPSPTKTGTEQAFNASFATMWGNVSLLMGTIGIAVVFAILLVTANAMMMSARERTREVAVLKTVGFSDVTLFSLVMAEAAFIAVIGAVLGLGGAKLLYKSTNFNAGGFLPGFNVTGDTLLIGGAIALVLMVASGVVPALRAARLPVVQALRQVG